MKFKNNLSYLSLQRVYIIFFSNEKMVDIQPKVEEEKCVPSQDEEPSESK